MTTVGNETTREISFDQFEKAKQTNVSSSVNLDLKLAKKKNA